MSGDISLTCGCSGMWVVTNIINARETKLYHWLVHTVLKLESGASLPKLSLKC